MPVYEYIAIDANGKRAKGTVDSDSIRSARQRLRTQNIFPTEINEAQVANKSKSKDIKEILRRFDRVSTKKIAVATRLLATLCAAGLPLVGALQSLSEQMDSLELKRVVIDIKERVEQGSSLAKSLGAYPKMFPRLYVNMVAAGEASGTLDTVLLNLADYYEAQLDLQRRVTSALLYPVLLLVFCTLVVIGLVTFVVPNIVQIFVKQKVSLPIPTQVVMAFSGLITGYWYVIIALIMLTIWGTKRYYASPKGRENIDRWLLKAPIFGPLYTKVTTARVANTLGTLLTSGVELLSALDIVKNIVGNVHMTRAIEEARDGVREGKSLSKELSKSGLYPNLLCQMIAIGERSGKLESMLTKAGTTFSREANAAISGLTTLIEPLMLLILGVIVFIIVISVLLPMTELMRIVQPTH